MKNLKKVLLTIVALVSLSSYSQDTTNVLMIKFKKTGREILLKEKTKIIVKTKDGNKYKGRFLIQEESIHFYESNEWVEIKDIDVIKYKTKFGRILNNTLIGVFSVGAVSLGFAGLNTKADDKLSYYFGAAESACVAIMLTPFTAIKSIYKSEKYTFSIEKSVKTNVK